jgi:hypothetical protein
MMRARARLWVLPALLLAIPSCHSSDRTSGSRPPEDFSLSFGEGGGFTGQWLGHTIRPDGVVLQWRGRAAEENGQPVGRLAEEKRRALWLDIQRLGVFNAASDKRGDLVRIVKVTANGKTYTVAWTPKAAPPGEAPARTPVVEFYERCLEAISDLDSEGR